ncbi:unnamed protein product, partial [Amoebophrya sp. A120]
DSWAEGPPPAPIIPVAKLNGGAGSIPSAFQQTTRPGAATSTNSVVLKPLSGGKKLSEIQGGRETNSKSAGGAPPPAAVTALGSFGKKMSELDGQQNHAANSSPGTGPSRSSPADLKPSGLRPLPPRGPTAGGVPTTTTGSCSTSSLPKAGAGVFSKAGAFSKASGASPLLTAQQQTTSSQMAS